MTPFYFGSGKRRLFGVYTPPRAAGKGSRAVVLCHPWGQEYIRAHRSMRQLGNMLSSAGHHVLRFDYFGTGDSAGEASEADLTGWEEDIATAIEEMKDTSGLPRVTLVGLRLGASLAARLSVRRAKELETLVLWDPLVNGSEYLEEILQHGNPRPQDSGRDREILGFPLTDALATQIGALELQPLVAALPPRTHLIASKPLASHVLLRRELQKNGRDGALVEEGGGPFAWLHNRDLGAGAVPVKVLERIVQWIQ